MWTIDTLIAVDENDNSVVLVGNKITLNVTRERMKLYRIFDVKDTPPCLQIAIDDLINQLANKLPTK